MIDERDPAGTFFLALVMLYLGAIAGRSRQVANRFGSYAALVVAAFYVLYAALSYGRMEPASILGITWRSLLAAAITYGIVALPTAVVLALVDSPTKTVSRWIDRRVSRIADWFRRRRRCQEELALQRAAAERDRQLAPFREDARRQAEAAQRSRAELEELRRKLRFECDLGYHRLRPTVVQKFPRKVFARLVDDALQGQTETHLRRAVQDLMDTVNAVVGDQSRSGLPSLMDMADDFDQRRLAVQNSNFSSERKDDLIKYLNIQEEIEIRKVLER
jgi:hypothetical protein